LDSSIAFFWPLAMLLNSFAFSSSSDRRRRRKRLVEWAIRDAAS
jgi:hypothetical protein